MSTSAAYLNGEPVEIAVPDLSGVPGWDPTWGYPSGDELLYVVLAEGWSGGSPNTPADGLTRQVATLSAAF